MLPDGEEKQQAQENLEITLRYGTLYDCRRKYLLKYFNEDYEQDNCEKL